MFDRNLFFRKPVSEIKTVPQPTAKAVKAVGLGKAFGLEEKDGKYTTTEPQLWHVLKTVLSRQQNELNNLDKISKEDRSKLLNFIVAVSYLFTGTRVKEYDKTQQQYYKTKDQTELLKDFLIQQGKIYEGSYTGKVK